MRVSARAVTAKTQQVYGCLPPSNPQANS